jgi:hypothetical protein
VLRAGGTVGTVTWAHESQPRASAVWDEGLAAFDVPTLADHGNHRGLDHEDDIRSLLDANGLVTNRVWREPIEHTFTPESYLRLRTGGGCGRARLAAVDSTTSHAAITHIGHRLRALRPDDFTFRGEVICAVSRKAA